MAKFIFLYKGPATPMDNMSEEQSKTITAQWNEWMTKVGPAMLDMGNPMSAGVSVVDDGSEGTADEFSGYSIIEATDMAAAKALTEGHPFLSDHTGKFSVDIFELLPVPSM
jgi:hypothetical protein